MDGFAQNPLLIPLIVAIGCGVVFLGLWGLTFYRSRHNARRLSDLTTELQTKENLLAQARRMEAVGILAGSIVHNLNNMLAVILGHTRMAMTELPAESGTMNELKKVSKAGHMATDLVKEISDFYRQADQALKPTDLVPVVRDTLKLLQDILPPTVEIRAHLTTRCGPVMASATGVQQILMNLFSNAVQAIKRRQGIIEITLREERIEQWHKAVPQDLGPGSYVKLTVTDNGRGMDSQTLEHIFNSYFSASDEGQGMGIGLSTVHRILKDHDGATIAHSTPGRGTSFDLYFPMIAWKVETSRVPSATGKAQATPGLAEVPTEERLQVVAESQSDLMAPITDIGNPSATVLLIDDQEMVLQVTARGLERLGYRVISHTDGRRALDDFIQTPEIFDVVITDQIMPHISGIKLTRKIRAIRPNIPVLLITGFRDSFNEQQAREAGISDFVLKPTSHRDLGDLIQRVMLRQEEGRN